jgi:hypothetical protein
MVAPPGHIPMDAPYQGQEGPQFKYVLRLKHEHLGRDGIPADLSRCIEFCFSLPWGSDRRGLLQLKASFPTRVSANYVIRYVVYQRYAGLGPALITSTTTNVSAHYHQAPSVYPVTNPAAAYKSSTFNRPTPSPMSVFQT